MLNQVSDVMERRDDIAESYNCYRLRQQGGRLAQSDTTNVGAAVNRLIARSQAGGGPEIEFYDNIPIDELPSELQAAVFPIVQELLLNACRHSKSKNVLVGLAQDDDRICIQVQDWGVGFVPEMVQPHKRGLKAIRQLVQWWGGLLSLDSQPGAGACIVVELPYSQRAETSDLIGDRQWRS